MGYEELSGVLWRERELLELLLFKLEEEQMVLATGRTRWLAHATREVEFVLRQIREAELLRAVELERLEPVVGDREASLADLADAAPAPWGELFASHRRAFLTFTSEITALAEANRDLLGNGVRAVAEALADVGGSARTYDPAGRAPATTSTGGRLVDRAV